jgi:hypothetical protein
VCAGCSSFRTARAEDREDPLRFLRIALGAGEPFIVLARFLNHLESFTADPAFIFVNRHEQPPVFALFCINSVPENKVLGNDAARNEEERAFTKGDKEGSKGTPEILRQRSGVDTTISLKRIRSALREGVILF